MKYIQIAIDGPAGAGKSSISKILAKKLGFIYIDTGAMYRALTYKVLEEKIDFSQKKEINRILDQIEISFSMDEALDKQKVFLDSRDITEEIRMPVVNQSVSKVASDNNIREKMVKKQQEFAENNNIVMDGRDIGTVVLPHADFKFFLTASIDERVSRRALELEAKGIDVNYSSLREEIRQRDEMDRNRQYGPLKKAEDAILIDSSDLSIEEVIEKLMNEINKK